MQPPCQTGQIAKEDCSVADEIYWKGVVADIKTCEQTTEDMRRQRPGERYEEQSSGRSFYLLKNYQFDTDKKHPYNGAH